MILLVVDTQKGCFDERLYSFETVRKNIKQLITIARENNVEVVYVQHDDGPGTDLDKSADNYEIYEEFAPRDNERRFEKNVSYDLVETDTELFVTERVNNILFEKV